MAAQAARVLLRLVRHAWGALRGSTGTTYGVWVYHDGDRNRIPYFLVIREWSINGHTGFSGEGIWEHYDDKEAHCELEFEPALDNDQFLAAEMAKGKLRRIGTLPLDAAPDFFGFFGDKPEYIAKREAARAARDA